MTTIHTKEDLIRALQEDPEWKAAVRSFILTEELLTLPARFDHFMIEQRETNQRVDQFISEQRETNQRVDRFITEQRETNQRVDRFISEQRETNRRVDRFISEQRKTNADQQQVNRRVESKLAKLANLANLHGDNLERRARESILNIAKDHLDLTRGRVLLSNNRDMDPGLRAAIDDAVEQGLVTDAAASDLEVADVILQGRRGQDRRYIHLAVEISRTIGNSDVRRARERADTLAAATGEEAAAAVIGGVIHSPQQRLALELGVTAATPAMFAGAVLE